MFHINLMTVFLFYKVQYELTQKDKYCIDSMYIRYSTVPTILKFIEKE